MSILPSTIRPRPISWIAALRLAVLVLFLFPLTTHAQVSPFAGGWTLDPARSALRFQSVKNETVIESSEFASFSGEIAEDGTATIRIQLDSVDTRLDLRNVRMRFLFFETFQYPEAVVTARLDAARLADLVTVRRKVIPLTYTLDLHGVSREWQTDVAVTLLNNDEVVVSTSTPVALPVAAHDLENGVRKLEEAANVVIVPSATISFDFHFIRNQPTLAAAEAAPALRPAAATPPRAAALEPSGAFEREACVGRFEILSRTDNIVFRSGWSELEPSSFPLLDSIADIILRCPDLRIEVAGHTDNIGSDAANQLLSERRARSVVTYLVGKGVDAAQLTSAGYGESRPVVPNTSAENRRRNRRIEFAVIDG